jgi:hypothetical protein
MDSVKEATKGTQFGFQDVAETARAFFAEGERGSGLVEKLKQIEDMASATGMGIQGVTNLFEAGIGADVMNPMLLKKLQVAGVPARQELLKALGMPDTEEGNKALDKMLKTGQVQFKTFWDQAAKDAEGTAERMSHTWSGQLHKMGVDIAQIGGDFMKPFLGQGGLEGVNGALEKLDGWVNAHQDTIKGWFDDAKQAAGDLIGVIKGVKGILDDIPGGIKTVAEAFVAWKSISAIASLIESLTTITALLKALPAVAELAGKGFLAAFGPVGAMVGGIALALDKLFSWANGPVDVSRLPPILPNTAKLPGGEPRPNTAGAPPTVGGIPIPGLIPGQSHAFGGLRLPGEAVVQKPMGKRGLVQWAEDSTGGEAYIPLAAGKRKRSLEIWRKTGRLLGAFDNGGLRGGGDSPFVPPGPFVGRWMDSKPWDPWYLAGTGQGLYTGQWTQDDQGRTLTRGAPWEDPWAFSGGGKQTRDNPWGLDWRIPKNLYARDPGILKWMEPWSGGTGIYNTLGGGLGINGDDWKGLAAADGGIFGVESFDDGGVDGDGMTVPATPGGLQAVYSLLGTLTGGTGGARTPYQLGGFGTGGIDCSGLVAAVVNAYLGSPAFSGRMDTGNEQSWLAARGFKPGAGGPGSMTVGWNGQHTAMSVGTINVESTTSHGISGVRVGPMAAGGNDSQFTNRMHLDMGDDPSALGVGIGRGMVQEAGKGKGSGGGSGGGDNPLSELLGIGQKGIKESLQIPGFTDYSQNPWVKSGMALLGMFTGGGGKGGGGLLGGLLGGGVGDMLAHPVRFALGGGKSAAHGYTQAPFGAGEAGPQVMPGGKLAPSGGGGPNDQGRAGMGPPIAPGGVGGTSIGTQMNGVQIGASQADVAKVMQDRDTVHIRNTGAAHATMSTAPGQPG